MQTVFKHQYIFFIIYYFKKKALEIKLRKSENCFEASIYFFSLFTFFLNYSYLEKKALDIKLTKSANCIEASKYFCIIEKILF